MSSYQHLRAELARYREAAEAAVLVVTTVEKLLDGSDRERALDMVGGIVGALPTVNEMGSWIWYTKVRAAREELMPVETTVPETAVVEDAF